MSHDKELAEALTLAYGNRIKLRNEPIAHREIEQKYNRVMSLLSNTKDAAWYL